MRDMRVLKSLPCARGGDLGVGLQLMGFGSQVRDD